LLDKGTKQLLPAEKLRDLFEKKGVVPEKETIVSCGTGVTAAVIDAALEKAGFVNVNNRKLYDGSWT
jgi:thiosulfate/3-mercaptopyruvate sulfurtransferase